MTRPGVETSVKVVVKVVYRESLLLCIGWAALTMAAHSMLFTAGA